MNDQALMRLAGRQHGLAAVRQLALLGYSEHHIRHRVERGFLFRVHRGVYALTGTRDTFEYRVMAAVLAAGSGALASHRCAAVLLGFRRIRCDTPVVTVAGRAAPQLGGIETHRRRTLVGSDRTRIGVIPVTSPVRTVLDLAAVLDLAHDADRVRLAGVIDDVLVRKLATIGAFERMLARVGPSRLAGAPVVRALVAERRDGKKPSETGLEDELIEVFRAYGLPEPVRRYVVSLPGGGTVRFDAAYPELLLAFEADGDRHHKGLLDRMRDEARDEQCALLGWTTRRYGTDDIRDRPAGIADEVARLRAQALAA